MIAQINVAGGRLSVDVLKLNAKTIMVRLPDGNVIKRHILKDDVLLTPHKGITFSLVDRKIKLSWWRKIWYGLFGGLKEGDIYDGREL